MLKKCDGFSRRYEEDMYWRRMEEEQLHWDERRRIPDGGYAQGPPGPPGLLGVRPGLPIPQPQGPVVSTPGLGVDIAGQEGGMQWDGVNDLGYVTI